MRQHSGKLSAAFVVFMVLLIINMKKNMEFDQFDKRTATERLQLYEDALVVYALLYKIKDSPYMYLFKDQIALMLSLIHI